MIASAQGNQFVLLSRVIPETFTAFITVVTIIKTAVGIGVHCDGPK